MQFEWVSVVVSSGFRLVDFLFFVAHFSGAGGPLECFERGAKLVVILRVRMRVSLEVRVVADELPALVLEHQEGPH